MDKYYIICPFLRKAVYFYQNLLENVTNLYGLFESCF